MPVDIFISYAQPDEPQALALFERLEARSLSCWIAPRSIEPGVEWAHAIVQAIDDCQLLLLVLSVASNLSDPVMYEVALAQKRRRPILPVRIAAVEPARGMEFYLSSRQFFDAFPLSVAEYAEPIAAAARAFVVPRTGSPGPAADAAALTIVPAARPGPAPAGDGDSSVEPAPPQPGMDAPERVVLDPAAVREIVGFDLGHGETAVAKAALDGQAHPKVVALGGKRAQVSALGFHPRRGLVVGEEAVLDPDMDAVRIAFKEPPDRSAATRQIVSDYLGAYYRALLDGGHIRGGGESHLFVGCPSGWTREDMALYEETLRRSGVPRLTVVKESRAALLNVIESGGITQDELRANVLLVDLGSSTTDLTLVTGGTTEAPLDFGVELGAALIEGRILEHAIAAHPQRDQVHAALAADPQARERCEFLCRRVKEEYFSNESLYQASRRSASAGVEPLADALAFVPAVNAALMERILSEPLPSLSQESWTEAFRRLLVDARERLDALDCTPAAVVATGGASRMAFVQRLCEDVFPGSKFRRDEEPEAAIARGLALWGRVFFRTADFEAAVTAIADAQIPAIVERRADDLVVRIASATADGLIEAAARQPLVAWRTGAIATLAELEPSIQEAADAWLAGPAFNELVGEAIDDWAGPLRTELSDLTAEVCRRYGIPLGALDINPELRRIGNPTLNAAESVSAGIIDSLVVVLVLAAGAIFVMAGPGGWIAAVVSSILGVSSSGEEVRRMNFWKPVRTALVDVDACITTMKTKLQKGFEEELRNGAVTEMSQRISAGLKSVLLERAEEARLLIR